MIPVQRLTDIRTLTAAAARHGVSLPKEIAAQAEHLETLEGEQRTRATLNPAQCASQLAAHLGNPAAMTKARAKVAAEMAAADADAAVTAHLLDRCAAVLHQRIRQSGDVIAAAFAPAVSDALHTLTEQAARLPQAFKADDAATLSAAEYTAWTEARDAHALIQSLEAPLRLLHGTGASDLLAPDAVRALRYVEPPHFHDVKEAGAFARALAGIRHAGSSIGPVNLDGVFTPTAVAHLGGTFAWATPAEVTARVEAINAAAIPKQRERDATRAYVTL
ncbi:hypothetical protein ACOCJ4_02545 [Knoellia sp. CPCC 206435]|uniref:hypothetical protein n=1 Tax=Knoellia terrae TaxID=3404797 RepID=UPI003B42E9A9